MSSGHNCPTSHSANATAGWSRSDQQKQESLHLQPSLEQVLKHGWWGGRAEANIKSRDKAKIKLPECIPYLTGSAAITLLATAVPQEGLQMFSKGNFDKESLWHTVLTMVWLEHVMKDASSISQPSSLLHLRGYRLCFLGALTPPSERWLPSQHRRSALAS